MKCYFGKDGDMICPNSKPVQTPLPPNKKCGFKKNKDYVCEVEKKKRRKVGRPKKLGRPKKAKPKK